RLVQVTSRGCPCLEARTARQGAPPQSQTKSLRPASTDAPTAKCRQVRAPVTTPSSVHFTALIMTEAQPGCNSSGRTCSSPVYGPRLRAASVGPGTPSGQEWLEQLVLAAKNG